MSTSITKNSRGSGQPVLTSDQVREIVIRELRAEELTKDEQDKLMQMVGEALMERATLELMKDVPKEVLIEISEDDKDLNDPDTVARMMQQIAHHVPEAENIVVNAIRAGLQDYQEHLDNEIGTVGK